MIYQTAPLPTSPSPPLRESYGDDRDSTGMQLPIIGKEKGRVGEMLYQGSGESGIGVQTAIQQCQPADGRLGAYVGPLVSHRGVEVRGNVAPRVLRRRNTSEFVFISAEKTDFNCLKCGSSGTADSCLSLPKKKIPPSFLLRASPFPLVAPAFLSSKFSFSLSYHTHLFLS